MAMALLSRTEWGAGSLKAGHVVDHARFVGLAVHHTVMVLPDYDRDGFLHGDLDDIARYMRQLQKARPDISPGECPYSFVVFRGARDEDCVVATGRGLAVTGAHTAGFNSTRYGVAYAGNASVDRVTAGVLEGFRWVGQHLAHPESARKTIGHRDVKVTECPGNHLYAALSRIQPPFFATPIPAPEDDDMARIIRTDEADPTKHEYAVTDWVQRRGVDDIAGEVKRLEKILGPVLAIPRSDFDSIPVAK